LRNWQELGGPAVSQPDRKGFRSRLMGSLARQLGGVIAFDWAKEGLGVELRVDPDAIRLQPRGR